MLFGYFGVDFLIKNKSIRNEFILWTLLICVLPFIIGMYYIKQLIFEQIQDDFQFLAQQATGRIRADIDNGIIKPAIATVKVLARDDRTKELAELIGDKKIAEKSVLEDDLYRYFANYEGNLTNMMGLAIGTEQGGYFQYPNFISDSVYDPRMRPWYEGALKQGTKPYITEPYFMKYTRQMVVSVAQAVKRDGRTVGVVVAGWSVQELQKEVEQLKIGLSGYVIILNQNNKIIVSPRNDWLLKTPQEINFPELADLTDTEKLKYVNFQGEKRLVYVSKSMTTDWNIIVVIDEKEILDKVYEYLRPIFMACGTMIVFILIFIFLSTKRNVINPIESLTRGAEAIAKGNLQVYIDIKKDNEFGILAKTFNKMVEKLKEYFTKVREQNEILYKREQEFKTLVENAEDIILRVDNKLNILYVNPVFGRYIAKTAEDLCGQKVEVLGMPAHFIKTISDIYAAPDATSENMLIEFEFTTNGGKTLNWQAHVIPEFSLKGALETILLIIRDITQQKKLEKQLIRLDRLNTTGEIAAGIAHEIRNPMTTVRGFLQLLSKKNPAYRTYYSLMIEELDSANAIITEFLSLAKNKMVNRRYCNLNDIIKAISPLLQSDATLTDKIVALELGDIHELLLDDKEIRQLIINLVRNGLEAIEAKEVVTIRTFEDKEDVVLSIADQGQGINPEILKNIGIPFQTTKDTGTGLGLAICYSIAARHKAKINVETSENGTEFFIRFAKNSDQEGSESHEHNKKD